MSLRKVARRVWRLPPLKYAVPQQLLMVSWQWAVALTAMYATPEVVVRLVQRLSPGTFPQFVPGGDDEQSLGLLQAIVVCIAAALYGISRPAYYHPRRREAYRLWLEQTPWTSRQPLPLGPAHLGWRDLFAMIALAGGALHAGLHPAVPPVLLAGFYLLGLPRTIAASGAPGEGTFLGFGLPLLAFVWDRPWWALGLTAALHAVAYVGLRRSLAAFPWRNSEEEKTHPSQRPPKWLPWPMDTVGPIAPDPPMSWARGLVIPALWGWWLYAALAQPAAAEWFRGFLRHLSPVALAAALGVIFAGCRLLNYAANRSAPISLRGRLRYGPLFVPRYDQVYFAPLCTAVLALVAPVAMWKLGVDDMATLCATVALTLAAAINLPPTKYAWNLTGGHQTARGTGKGDGTVGATE